MKWMIPWDKLGNEQREIIDSVASMKAKVSWINGHAGSGKSIVLLQSIADYLKKNPNKRVCVVVFTRALVDLLEIGIKQIPQLEKRSVPVLTIYQLKYRLANGGVNYDTIFCDEVQDIPLSFFLDMKNACSNLVVAGDSNQSIYNKVPVFEERPISVEELTSYINSDEKTSVVYRMTKSVTKMLSKVFSIFSSTRIAEKNDSGINLNRFENRNDELKWAWEKINNTNSLRPSDVCAILLYSHDSIQNFINTILVSNGFNTFEFKKVGNGNEKWNYDGCNNYLTKSNVPLMYIGNNHGSLEEADRTNKIVIMTYHSAKGLDFDYVLLPLLNHEMYLQSNVDSLLMVALSRSKQELVMTFTGSLYSYLDRFLADIEVKEPSLIEEDEHDTEIWF